MTIANFDRDIPFPSPDGVARRSLTVLRFWGVALRESLFAYRQYEHLKTMGMPHRAALTKALDASSARFE